MDSRIVNVKSAEQLWGLIDKISLHSLYDNCFGNAKFDPEFGGEDFEVEKVASFFEKYINNGILLLLLDNEASSVIGFAAAVPLEGEQDVLEAIKDLVHDTSSYWYHADIGVHSDSREKGLSKLLLKEFLETIPANYVVMRARKDNDATIGLHMKHGAFDFLYNEDGNKVTQPIFLKRKTGRVESDDRYFLTMKK